MSVKIKCTKCLLEKDDSDFYSDGRGGKKSECKPCHKKAKKAYYKENRQKILKQKRKYASENKEKIVQRSRIYFKKNREEILRRHKEWAKDNKETKRRITKRWVENNRQHYNEYHYKWRKDNPDKHKAIKARRDARRLQLPNNLTTIKSSQLFDLYGNRCFLTRKTEKLHLEHFVALSTGHVGTLYENCYLIHGNLNSSKKDRNPFEWIENQRENIQQNMKALVSKLARLNCLTEEEYKNFVNWCYMNKRDVKVIKQDPRHSIEIWREARQIQLPLPKYTERR